MVNMSSGFAVPYTIVASPAIFQPIQLTQPTRLPTSGARPSYASQVSILRGLVVLVVNSIAIFVISL